MNSTPIDIELTIWDLEKTIEQMGFPKSIPLERAVKAIKQLKSERDGIKSACLKSAEVSGDETGGDNRGGFRTFL